MDTEDDGDRDNEVGAAVPSLSLAASSPEISRRGRMEIGTLSWEDEQMCFHLDLSQLDRGGSRVILHS